VTLVTGIFGLMLHAGFLVMFLRHEMPAMALVNVASVSVWAMALALNRRGRHGAAIVILSLEMVAHACLASWFVGLGSGFQYYIWPAACLFALHPQIRPELGAIAGVAASALFASLYVVFPADGVVEALREVQSRLHYVNALCAPLPVVLVVVVVRQAFEVQSGALREAAVRDELTGLYNRRFGLRFLRAAVERSHRDGTELFVVMADADHFKAINDEYGHHVGDAVLGRLAHVLGSGLRNSDMLCRWGGEEFLLAFSGFPAHGIRERKETLRQSIADLETMAGMPATTMSFGLARLHAGESADAIVRRADRLMYEAKQSGRNRIEDDLGARPVASTTSDTGLKPFTRGRA